MPGGWLKLGEAVELADEPVDPPVAGVDVAAETPASRKPKML